MVSLVVALCSDALTNRSPWSSVTYDAPPGQFLLGLEGWVRITNDFFSPARNSVAHSLRRYRIPGSPFQKQT
jgi:hypothetical protein